MRFDATLVSNKALYAHPSRRLVLPAWMGMRSHATGIRAPIGKLAGDMVPAVARGHFRGKATKIDSSDSTTFDVLVKENIGTQVYNWQDYVDFDIRTQCGGRIDNPMNWDMIKRIINCWCEAIDTDSEASVTPRNNGEVIATLPVRSLDFPIIIKRVAQTDLNLSNMVEINNLPVAPTISAEAGYTEGYIMPAFSSSKYGIAMSADMRNFNFSTFTLSNPIISVSSYQKLWAAVDTLGAIYCSSDESGLYQGTGISGTPVVVKVFSYSCILVGTSTGAIYLSTDGGHIFQVVDAYNAIASGGIVGFCGMADAIYAITATGNIAMSTDGGTTFERWPDLPGVVDISDIQCQDGIIYVTGYFNTTDLQVLASTDLETWLTVLSLTASSIPALSYTVRPKLAAAGPGVVYLAATYLANADTDYHSVVYRSVNWGMPHTWELLWSEVVDNGIYNLVTLLTDIAAAAVNDVAVTGVQIPLP